MLQAGAMSCTVQPWLLQGSRTQARASMKQRVAWQKQAGAYTCLPLQT